MFVSDFIKMFEDLHSNKIRGFFYEYENPHMFYFFCLGNKFVFIKRFRKRYFVCCSCQCNLGFEQHQRVFDIYRKCDSLNDAIYWYKFAISKINSEEL